MLKKYFLIYLVVFIFIACINNYALTTEEKIKIYLKYDEMFHDSENKETLGIEKGYKYEILDINKINSEYRNIAIEYQNILINFIDENFIHFKSLFTPRNGEYYLNKHLEKIYEGFEYAYHSFHAIKENMDKYFKKYDTLIRSICGWEMTFLFQFGRTLKNNTSTILSYYEGKEGIDVFWSIHYFAQLWGKEPLYKDSGKVYNRDLTQDYWFYESNMKIVVVQRMRDKEGNYFGDISMEFYKLDNFDKLFNQDGTPKENSE